jgi:iron complex transport system substrate-binding protein
VDDGRGPRGGPAGAALTARIVSLIPSATEIVSALGLREQLVGRSHECDFPPGVEALPAITEPKMDPGAGTLAIDRDVRRLVEQGLSVYRIDSEALERLRPDIVVTQDQCQVCAVSLEDVTAAVSCLAQRDVRVVSLSPLSLADVFRDVLTVARALGVEERGHALVAGMRGRLEATAAAPSGPRPRVAHIEWIAPLMVGGHWMHELVEAAGGEHRLGVRDGHNRPVLWEDLRAYDPEVMVIAPCGFKIPQTERDLPLLEQLSGWSDLTAVRNGRVFLSDGNAFFNRPGPRLVDTADIVQAAIFGRLPHHRFPAEALRAL